LSKAQRGSYSHFLGYEILIAVASFTLAYLGATRIYAFGPVLFDTIAKLVPAPIYPTGFAIAYTAVAGLIFAIVNSILFFTGRRKL